MGKLEKFLSEGYSEAVTTGEEVILPLDAVVVLVDSDTIAYRPASAGDGRHYTVGVKSFKYKADADKYCADNGIDPKSIELDYYPDPIEFVLHSVKQVILSFKKAMRERFKGRKIFYEYFHTHKENFRKEIIPEYKISRDKIRRPFHLQSCKDYVEERHGAIVEPGLEADDLIGIRAYECLRMGIEFVIVTNDKDLKTIPCKHYYDWTKDEWIEVCERDAMSFFYAQCIAGDTTDDIPGIDGYGINPKGTGKAQKYIQGIVERWDAGEFGNVPLEQVLYSAALDAWLEGGPGRKGFYGCKSLEEIQEEFRRSAQCLFILHNRGELWKEPDGCHFNY